MMQTPCRPFFVMPGSALKDLREELELMEGVDPLKRWSSYGYRAGVGLVARSAWSAAIRKRPRISSTRYGPRPV